MLNFKTLFYESIIDKEILNEVKIHYSTVNRILNIYEKNFDIYPDDVVLSKKNGEETTLYLKYSTPKNSFITSFEDKNIAIATQTKANQLITKYKKQHK